MLWDLLITHLVNPKITIVHALLTFFTIEVVFFAKKKNISVVEEKSLCRL